MRKQTKLFLIGFLVSILCMTVGRMAVMSDYLVFREACEKVLHFQNPYTVETFDSPPWVLIPLLPLTFLPIPMARMLLFLAGGASFVYACHRLEFGTWQTLLFMLSPPVIYTLAQGNIDWLVLWGLVLPYPWDIPFFLAKPQMGWGIVLWQWVETKGSWVIAITVCAAMGIVAVFAFPITQSDDWNVAIRPRLVAVVVGLACCYLVGKQHYSLALIATVSILISPYLTLGSYSMVLLLWAADHKWLLPLAVVAGWGVLILGVVM